MSITNFRQSTVWFIVGAIGVFSLAAVACTSTPVDDVAGNEESPNIGAPSGVIDGTGPGAVQTSNGLPQTVSIANGEIVASGFAVPAVEPISSLGIPAPFGVPTLYGSQVSATGTANSGIWVNRSRSSL